MKRITAVVIGAGSLGPGWGNGKASAVQLAREGAKVVIADVNVEGGEETAERGPVDPGPQNVFNSGDAKWWEGGEKSKTTEAFAPVASLPSATLAKIGSSSPLEPVQVCPPFLGCVPPTIWVP